MSNQPAQPPFTTAAALVSFRHELLEGGFSPEEAAGLSGQALHELAQTDGICIRLEAAK